MLTKYNLKDYIPYIKIGLLLKDIGLRIVKDNAVYIQAYCPNPDHQESHPSFFVNKNTGVFHCFGCGFKGTLLKLVNFLGNFNNDIEACNFISHYIDSDYVPENINMFIPIKKREINNNNNIQEDTDERIGIHKINLPEGYVKYAPEAIWYLSQRNLDIDLIKQHFEFGFCYSGKYQGRVVFPIYFNKTLVMFQARAIMPGIEPKDLFNAGVKKQYIYNYDNLVKNEFVIVTESILDVLQIYPYYKNVTAIFGSHLLKEQAELLLSITNKICIIPDPDNGFKPFIESAIQYLYHKASLWISTFDKQNLANSLFNMQPIERYLSYLLRR